MKTLSRPAREILKTPASKKAIAHMTNLSLVAHITQHVALLDDAALEKLPSMGVVLFDPDQIGELRVSFESIAVKVLAGNNDEIREIFTRSLRSIAPRVFEGLTEWALISSHQQNRSPTSWEKLSRSDQIACVCTMMSCLGPLEMLVSRNRGALPRH